MNYWQGSCWGRLFWGWLAHPLHLYWRTSFVIFTLVLISVAVVGKLVGSGLGLFFFRRNAWELASEPLLTYDQFSALVLMAFVTTLLAPLSSRWAVQRGCLPDEKEAVCRLFEEV